MMQKNESFDIALARWCKREWSYIKKRFDKAFYRGGWRPFFWLLILLVAGGLILLLVGRTLGIGTWRVVELILDPGSFAGAEHRVAYGSDVSKGVWFQFLVTLFGAVAFTCFLINTIGNWLERRIDRYRKGNVAYDEDDHILILGAGSMVVSLVKTLLAREENRNRDIVILTSTDVEELRARLFSEISSKMSRGIYVYYGSRVRKETLKKLDAFQTTAIYILGEDDEPAHDSLNVQCYELLKDVCARSKRLIDCFMMLEHPTSLQLFYYRQDDVSGNLRLTLVNSLENAAQRVLVSRYYRNGVLYPALDRTGIGMADDRRVHLVIVGMSQMGYVMAVTAAHICHFPNFRNKGLRTKITFIQSNIRPEMNLFLGRYRELMKLSYWQYFNFDNMACNQESFPDADYINPESDRKGFLDVEWEFIDGGIENPNVCSYLEQCAFQNGKSEWLSLAFCYGDPQRNVEAVLCLPDVVNEEKIPVFLYQPGGDCMVRAVTGTPLYANIYPFGMKMDGLDLQYQERLIRAMRISYLYSLENQGLPYKGMPSDAALIGPWFEMQYAFQQSNMHAANSIPFKLRSISNSNHRSLTDEEVELLAETEHNRWNMERLLVGFRSYTYADRQRFIDILGPDGKDEDKVALKALLDGAKKKRFKHKDIAPYDELPERTKSYDKAIVRNIIDVL